MNALPDTDNPTRRQSAFTTTVCAIFAAASILSGCASDRFAKRPPAWGDSLRSAADPVTVTPADEVAPGESAAAEPEPDRRPLDFYQKGTDVLVRAPRDIADAREHVDGTIKLNFQGANLLEVVKVILGDTLNLNYIVDPAVQGSVSMLTTRALRREDLIPTLELLLRMNGAALVTSGDLYRVVPLANALAEVRAPQLGDSTLALPSGFSVRIVPLQYVAAEEMAEILAPMMSGSNQLLRVDSRRNLLVIASAGAEMERLLDTIEVFDVDRMSGMSVALFTPDSVDATTLADDLEKLLDDQEFGLMPGLVRFIVIERINGLMVVASRAEHLARVREWVNRLDRDTGDAAPRLFVYRVQNGKATELASALQGVFQSGLEQSPAPASLAPGLEPVTIGEAPAMQNPPNPPGPNVDTPRDTPAETASMVGAGADGLSIEQGQNVQIIADEPNNALLILATGIEYRQILAALRQLDVSPQQVLIEVTIAEVTLTDNLAFGVEWFFKNNFGSKTGLATLDLGPVGLGATPPGFSYVIQGGDGIVNAVLNMLATESHLSVISSPSLLVLNNHEASIQVGDEVPIITQQQQATVDDSNIINSIEYRETGILLTVKPRINAGGLVIMEVEQEASQVPTTSTTDPLTPRIRQRKISSTVAVNSGDTIILGGLIENARDTSEAGVPGFHKLPFIGALFGTKADNQDRTELIVLITPRAITNSTTALQVTDDYRRRLKKLIPGREADNREPSTRDAAAASGSTTTRAPKNVSTTAPADPSAAAPGAPSAH